MKIIQKKMFLKDTMLFLFTIVISKMTTNWSLKKLKLSSIQIHCVKKR